MLLYLLFFLARPTIESSFMGCGEAPPPRKWNAAPLQRLTLVFLGATSPPIYHYACTSHLMPGAKLFSQSLLLLQLVKR